jgi:Pyridoxamine 5'-phosphate oxidase
MQNLSPRVTLDTRYSEEDVQATPWPHALALLEQAGLFWVSTVRPDGRPHVTPVVAVWVDGAVYFTSGPGEQKSRNLAANRHCAVTTGCNTWDEGTSTPDPPLGGVAVVVASCGPGAAMPAPHPGGTRAWLTEPGCLGWQQADDGARRHALHGLT